MQYSARKYKLETYQVFNQERHMNLISLLLVKKTLQVWKAAKLRIIHVSKDNLIFF